MIALFIIGFLLVFLLGLQQQNVTHEKHAWSVLTSYAIAGVQVLLIKEAVASDWVGALLLGTGGALGASASMVVHRMMREKSEAIAKMNATFDRALSSLREAGAPTDEAKRRRWSAYGWMPNCNPPPVYDKPPAPSSPPPAGSKRRGVRKTKRRVAR